MKLKETQTKITQASSLKESCVKNLDISFTKIIDDPKFGLLSSSCQTLNDKIKIHKIVKTLLFIREKKAHELINTSKTTQIGGCEKCNVNKWGWNSAYLKSYLKNITNDNIFIIRAGESRILGGISDNNCFYIYGIEYNLGDAYEH